MRRRFRADRLRFVSGGVVVPDGASAGSIGSRGVGSVDAVPCRALQVDVATDGIVSVASSRGFRR